MHILYRVLQWFTIITNFEISNQNNQGSGIRRVRDDHLANDAHSGEIVPNKHRKL